MENKNNIITKENADDVKCLIEKMKSRINAWYYFVGVLTGMVVVFLSLYFGGGCGK